jgi:hypothetical protein
MKKMDLQIKSLHQELSNSTGNVVIPVSWYPYIALIKTALKIVKIFTSDEVDSYIDDIISAIELIEAIHGS